MFALKHLQLRKHNTLFAISGQKETTMEHPFIFKAQRMQRRAHNAIAMINAMQLTKDYAIMLRQAISGLLQVI